MSSFKPFLSDPDLVDFGVAIPKIDRSTSIELITSTSETRLTRSRSGSITVPFSDLESGIPQNETPDVIARNQLREKLKIYFTETPDKMVSLYSVIDALNKIALDHFEGVFKIVDMKVHINDTSLYAKHLLSRLESIVHGVDIADLKMMYTMKHIFFGFLVPKLE